MQCGPFISYLPNNQSINSSRKLKHTQNWRHKVNRVMGSKKKKNSKSRRSVVLSCRRWDGIDMILLLLWTFFFSFSLFSLFDDPFGIWSSSSSSSYVLDLLVSSRSSYGKKPPARPSLGEYQTSNSDCLQSEFIINSHLVLSSPSSSAKQKILSSFFPFSFLSLRQCNLVGGGW